MEGEGEWGRLVGVGKGMDVLEKRKVEKSERRRECVEEQEEKVRERVGEEMSVGK